MFNFATQLAKRSNDYLQSKTRQWKLVFELRRAEALSSWVAERIGAIVRNRGRMQRQTTINRANYDLSLRPNSELANGYLRAPWLRRFPT